MKQKHQIIARGLRNQSLDGNDYRPAQSGRIEEIGFAHAKKDLQQIGISTRLSVQARVPASHLLSSSSPSLSKQNLVRRSKILEDLDINEPSGLKATMQRILRQPDLAGLSRLSVRFPSRENYESSGNPRKKQKANEDTSTDSSSSFLYDSPTRMGNSERPQVLTRQYATQTLVKSDDGQSYSDIHSSAHSSYVLDGKSAVGSNSFGSSLDRYSVMQEAGSSSSYQDSGFSELPFSDIGDKEHSQSRPDSQTHSASDSGSRLEVPPGPVFPSTHGSSELSSREVLKCQTPQGLVQENSSQHDAIGLHSASHELARARTLAVLNPEDTDNWFALENTSIARLASKRSSEHSAEDKENCRYGVGYVPSDPNIEYKPFVPLSTMLPSYSDEDFDDEGEIDGVKENALDSLMDIDAIRTEMDNPATDEIKFAAGSDLTTKVDTEISSMEEYMLEEERMEHILSEMEGSFNEGRVKTDVSSYRISRSRTNQFAFSIPTRSFATSPIRRLSSTRRSRFSFPSEYSVSSILASNSGRVQDLPNTPEKPLLICSEDSGSSVLSKSSLPFIGTPRRSDSRAITDELTYFANYSVHPDSANHTDIQHTEQAFNTTSLSATLITNPPDVNLASLPDSHQDKSPLSSSTEEWFATLRVIDGPDLFAGDEGDDDDDD
ncbi:hypothetical protein ACEPAH_8052 [Sanghuangporus vaninii]